MHNLVYMFHAWMIDNDNANLKSLNTSGATPEYRWSSPSTV